MIYKKFRDMELSALGMGGMRFPTLDGDYSKIDKAAMRELIATAMAGGINYYDTAWGYHGGASERVLGEILSEYPRDSFYLATKFPGYDLSNIDKVEKIFNEQLERCRVDYFDFYLFHNVCELNIDAYLDPKYGIFDYLFEQKRSGRIRHLGFSTHGTVATVKRFLDAYGEDIEFCQIQLNWLDYKLQNAKAKVDLLRERNIPIWVMEPLRGGRLVNLEAEYLAPLMAVRPGVGAPELAFRYLQTYPEVTVTLSGMGNMEQLKQNIAVFENEKPLNKNELEALYGVARKMTEKTALPCTACRYCTEHCPKGLDIPQIIEHYNEHMYSGGSLARMAIGAMPENKRPSACIGCHSCEAVCPQNIKISEMMRDFTIRLEGKDK